MNTKIEEKTTPETVKPVVEEKETVAPLMRQIIIETDGNDIRLIKAEVGGKIELIGVLQNVIAFLTKQQ